MFGHNVGAQGELESALRLPFPPSFLPPELFSKVSRQTLVFLSITFQKSSIKNLKIFIVFLWNSSYDAHQVSLAILDA